MSVVRNRSGVGRVLRLTLLGSVAGLCLTSLPAVAVAQDPGRPSGVATPQIVISGPGTPTTARDPVNVTGVGQMIVDQQNGFIGLCTATLINPRTVILAAHCVNERAANAYGAGGTPIGFGFSSNNNAAGASAFGGWLNNGHQTNTSRFMYNSNYVAYNPGSLEPAAASFLYSDVAVASLDTAARGIPTWSMLFSALPATPITANGTGYHVVIDGYGNNGTGTSGSSGGIDYRRRLAENMLGALASLDQFENFLFGGAATNLPQNLYWIDFDDPRRGTASASPFDFNAWRDNALPKEGITAAGDSGGPLILDTAFAKPVVIGVLSGGYTRFFNGQPANGYGTASFYQPLYLYWDWIAANNPYHYVSAIAGDANWNDASHWVTNLDPNYQIIGPNGQLVNGVPTSPGAGKTGGGGNFGQACFENGGVSDCLDVSTGVETVVAKPIGTGVSNGAAIVSADALLDPAAPDSVVASAGAGDGTRYGFNDLDAVRVPADAQTGTLGDVTAAALPPATLLNGLPGASNFTPNNFDGNRLTSTPPRYFDVTLSANGKTTLDTSVTVDRLTLAGAGAGLTITSTGSLTSNIDITQLVGTLQVDGALRTPGDFFIMAGGLSGQGVITTPFFTNMAGVIAPGTPTTIGTLTFNGNVILASGGALLINLGAAGASDKVAVAATQFLGGAPVDGKANVGGLVAFGSVAGTTPHFGDLYTFLTAEGGVTGAFQVENISAILRPNLLYGPTSIRVQIAAGLYADVVANSPSQRALAQLLDQNRGQYAQFAALYGPLDVQSQASIQTTLDGLAPAAETLKGAIGTASLDSVSNFYRGRLSEANGGEPGGTLELIGRPVEFAAASLDPLGGGPSLAGDVDGPVVVPHALPDNMRAYLAAGYLNGQSARMSGTPGTGKDDFNGYFLAAGVETALDDRRMVGVSLSATDLSGGTRGLPQTSDGRLYQVAVYGRHELEDGFNINGQLSAGRFDVKTTRVAAVGPSIFTLHTQDQANAFAGEVGVGYTAVGDSVTIAPNASLRVSRIDYGPTTETGGGPALQYQRDAANSLEGRLGVSVTSNAPGVRPYFDAAYVHAFRDQPTTFGANLAGGVGPNAIFALGGDDHDWAELGFGVSGTGENYRFTVAAETTVGRSDVENQTYRASVGFRF